MEEPDWARRRRERRAQWTARPPGQRDAFLLGVDQRRRRLGLAHKDFALNVLGCSKSSWSKVWNMRRPPSRYLIERILARFPGLASDYASAARVRSGEAAVPATAQDPR